MNKLAKILILFLSGILLLAVILMFLSPKNVVLEESITVDAPTNVSFNLVNDLTKWSLWFPWFKLDPEAIITYTDISTGVGAKWSWKGNEKIGEGSQTILKSTPSSDIKMALEFNGWDGESYSSWKFEEVNGSTKITWDFEGSDTAFPFRPFNLLIKGALKKSYKESLASLKNIVEKRANENIYRGLEIKESKLEEKHYIIYRQEVAFENIPQFYSQNLGSLFSKLQSAKLEMDGMPSGLFFKYDKFAQKTDMAAAIPISTDTNLKDASNFTAPSGRVIHLDYRGDYHGLENAHTAINEYLNDHGLFYNSPVIEEYITDPSKETNPEQWLTKISYYISEN